MINYQELKELLLEHSNYIITTHVNPDADAIGSEMALYYILKEYNYNIRIINYSEIPYNLLFLDNNNIIETYSPDTHDNIIANAEVLICVDFNRSDRLVTMRGAFLQSKAVKICIDHHLDPEAFAKFFFLDENRSSTGEILYRFIRETNFVKLNYNIAYNLYAAIMTDTGSFRFHRTTPELHRLTAELLEAGVDPNSVYDKIYDQSKFSKVKLLGRALNSLRLTESQVICYMILSRKDFIDSGAVESDTDGFVNFSLSIERVRVGVLFTELAEGFKVSFRSKGNIPVNKLAAEFGGGGHINAAGARFSDGNMHEKINTILDKAEEYYRKYKEIDV